MDFQRLRIVLALMAAFSLGMLVTPTPAHAQGDITLSEMTVRIWPEFDQPSALVILFGSVSADVPVPVDLSFTLPSGVLPHAAAYPDEATGQLFSAQSTQVGDTLTLTSPNGQFWIEFYDASLAFDGSRRTYTLALTSPYDIAALTYEVQSPYGASDLTVEPSQNGVFGVDQYGLPTFSVAQGSLRAGDEVRVSLSYTKADNTLSIDAVSSSAGAAPAALPGADSASETATTPTRSGLSAPAAILIVVGSLLIVGGGVYAVLRTKRPSPRRPAPTRRSGGGKTFCTKCGQQARPSDRFCRRCGAALR